MTLFPGSSHEMVSMYRLDLNELVMTHYCAKKNQPQMISSDLSNDETIEFVCDGHPGNTSSHNEGHMHRARLTFVDKDNIKAEWTSSEDGKELPPYSFEAIRQK